MNKLDRRAVLLANPGADLYGSDRMAVETTRGLVAHGRRVIVTVPQDGPLVPLLKSAGAEVLICPTPIIRKGYLSLTGILRLVWSTATSILKSADVLRRSRAGTMIVNTMTAPLWLIVSRLSGRYTVCHVHEGEASISGVLRRILYLPLIFSNRILINSTFSKEVLREAAPWLANRTQIIYNAVAGPPDTCPPRRDLTGPIKLLYFGRLSHRKGPHVAIRALKVLNDEGQQAHLSLLGAVFPGNEAYAEELRQSVADLGLENHVDFLGFHPSVWPYLAATDIALIPSTVDEPFGNTAVEAALAARPSIVSAVGGLPEASAHTKSTLLVPPSDPEALAAAVALMVSRWSDFARDAIEDSQSVAKVFSSERYGVEIAAAVCRSRFPQGTRGQELTGAAQ